MQPFAEHPLPGWRASTSWIRGRRAIGEEAPLRAVIESGERLLVCASVKSADPTTNERLWLTDRRFLFTRRQPGVGKVVVSVPITGCALDYENAAPYPLHLGWTDEAGRRCTESFRSETWKDSVGQRGSAGVTGGATGGIMGALIGVAVDTAIRDMVRTGGAASQDQKLYSTLSAACRAPSQVRPVDLTSGSLNTLGGRLLIGLTMGVFTSILLASGVYAVLGYQAKQAYEAAPICGSVPGTDCRLHQPAVVTDYRGASSKDAYCDLWMSQAGGSDVTANLHTFTLCARDPRGEQMTLEYWRGSLTGVVPPVVGTSSGTVEETNDNPEYNWRFGEIMTGLCSLLWAMFGGAALAVLVAWRKRRSLLLGSARLAGYLG